MWKLQRLKWAAFVLTMAVLLPAVPLRGDSEDGELHTYLLIGNVAPDFACRDDLGKTWKSTQHVGKKVIVVYFYLGDFFKDSITQADSFRKEMSRLKAAGVEVVGVSGDTAENHALFKKTYRLTHTLLADEKGEVGKAFGVAMSGGGVLRIKDGKGEEIEIRRGCSPASWTFMIGKNGRILYKNTRSGLKDGPARILNVLERLARGDD